MGQPSDEEVIVIEQTVPASQETLEADYTEAVVPAHARRSNFRILMTFLSMQVVFGAVLVGYGARLGGLTLGELMIAMALAATVMTVYCIGSANVGAVAGQTHAVTTRNVFGTVGSWLVSLLLVIDGMGFYLFTVLFIVTIAEALFGTLPAVAFRESTRNQMMALRSHSSPRHWRS